MAHALIVDDDPDVVDWLQEVARMEGFTIARAHSLREARIELGRQRPDVLLTDLRLPDGEGIELVRELEKPDATEVIVVTGHATVDSGVAPTSATVLLIGESGTGKELAAQTLHELSRRREGAFLPLNCGAVAPQLIESELFGHERGSFTGADRQHKGFFERANGGTIFLDEITEMPMELQVKLLRVLETGIFMRVGGTQQISSDVRILAATNRDPEKAVLDGKLR